MVKICPPAAAGDRCRFFELVMDLSHGGGNEAQSEGEISRQISQTYNAQRADDRQRDKQIEPHERRAEHHARQRDRRETEEVENFAAADASLVDEITDA